MQVTPRKRVTGSELDPTTWQAVCGTYKFTPGGAVKSSPTTRHGLHLPGLPCTRRQFSLCTVLGVSSLIHPAPVSRYPPSFQSGMHPMPPSRSVVLFMLAHLPARGPFTHCSFVPEHQVPIVRKSKSKTTADTDGSSSDDDEEEVERMTSEDAYWFPVL